MGLDPRAPKDLSSENWQTNTEGSTRLTYTGLPGGLCYRLEHLKIKTRLIDERFVSVIGEYVFLK